MSNRLWRFLRGAGMVVMWAALAEGSAAAQTPARGENSNEIQVDPIKCWWKTDRSAVLVGERFTLTLTCGVIETSRLQVTPNMDQLDPAAVELAPFDVLGGTRHEDVLEPPWRYFQYEYQIRLVAPEYFGQDVEIPALTVTYNIQSAAGGGAQGRDQRYLLPALPLRVMSLVPKGANDIRDSSRETFADVENRRFRATTELVAAAVLLGFSVMMLAFAGVKLVRRGRARIPVAVRAVPRAAVLQSCLREIGRVASNVGREGWTPQRAGQALTALRVGTAVAVGRPVAQQLVDATVPAREGQIAVRKRLFSRKRVLVSAPMTSESVDRHRIAANGQITSKRLQGVLDDLRDSLVSLSAARYGRNGNFDTVVLDQALDNGRTALRQLRVATLWPVRAADKVARSAATLGSVMWTR